MTLHDFPHRHIQRLTEPRPVHDECVKLAVLPARVDTRRQQVETVSVVPPSGELRWSLRRIDAGHECPDARFGLACVTGLILDVRAVPAPPLAAVTPLGKEPGGQDEQTRLRVQVPR